MAPSKRGKHRKQRKWQQKRSGVFLFLHRPLSDHRNNVACYGTRMCTRKAGTAPSSTRADPYTPHLCPVHAGVTGKPHREGRNLRGRGDWELLPYVKI